MRLGIHGKLGGVNALGIGRVDGIGLHGDKVDVLVIGHRGILGREGILCEAHAGRGTLGHPHIQVTQVLVEREGARLSGLEHDGMRDRHTGTGLADVTRAEAVDAVTRVVLAPPEHAGAVKIESRVDGTVGNALSIVT